MRLRGGRRCPGVRMRRLLPIDCRASTPRLPEAAEDTSGTRQLGVHRARAVVSPLCAAAA